MEKADFIRSDSQGIFPSLVAPISGWPGWHNGKHPVSFQEKRIKLGDVEQEETCPAYHEWISLQKKF